MKIPGHLKNEPVIACGGFAIWCKGAFTAMFIMARLNKKNKKNGLPIAGRMTYKGKKYYWCRYGFHQDPAIYTKSK